MSEVTPLCCHHRAPAAPLRPPRGRASRWRDDSGQALVESAIVIPLMVFLILGVIQIAMVQQARLMTDYAAFYACRSGIVWNADPFIMENAAIIALMPTNESLAEEADFNDPVKLLKRIMHRALMYQINRHVPAAVNGILGKIPGMAVVNATGDGVLDKAVNKGSKEVGDILGAGVQQTRTAATAAAEAAASSALSAALGYGDDRLVKVTVVEPHLGLGATVFSEEGASSLIEGTILDAEEIESLKNELENLKGDETEAQLDEATRQQLEAQRTLLLVGTGMGIYGDIEALKKGNLSHFFDLNKFVTTTVSGHFGMQQELDFDYLVDPKMGLAGALTGAGDADPAGGSRLVIKLRYLYVMRVPFANWVIQGTWLAAQAGKQLYGAVWNPQEDAPGETGFRKHSPRTRDLDFEGNAWVSERDIEVVAKMADEGVYAIPLTASYAMRAQSNPYRRNALVQ